MGFLRPKLLALAAGMTRYQKRFVLILSDLLLLNFAMWTAMSLRYGELYLPSSPDVLALLIAIPVMAVALFFQVGLYRHVTRHFNASGDKLIAGCLIIAGLCLGVGTFLLGATNVPRTVLLMFPIIGLLFVGGSRRFAGWFLSSAGVTMPPMLNPEEIQSVVLYGAGTSALELIHVIKRSPRLDVAGVVDPDPTLWRQYVGGIRVEPPNRLPQIIAKHGVTQVLVAMQKATRKERLEILNQVAALKVDVRVVPATEDIVTGRMQVTELRRVQAIDLLGRAPVPPDPTLMARTVKERTILVTGAGGSIGSEIVRQIVKREPRHIILLEASESALYEIEQQVGLLVAAYDKTTTPPKVTAILGSVLDAQLIGGILSEHAIDAIYHAAAFKHLPIVERNIAAGVVNNIFGTEVVARAAVERGVPSFVLISTDKAVRPSSVMGASKRVAELLLQAMAGEKPRTTFSIVRFGNVLDSSGSVVPLFRRQIEAGGPLTVTHPDAVRYFISIPEAAELVIQASAMARGGEVFALDMGEPVKIVDLARMMIRLSGLQVRDAENPDGQIEIAFMGLRPGEKLAEELYISGKVAETEHARIQRIDEPSLSLAVLQERLAALRRLIEAGDIEGVKAMVFTLAAAQQGTEHVLPVSNVAPMKSALASRVS
jgi:FlaA1/EpsC-like NDP-sugar epimerase